MSQDANLPQDEQNLGGLNEFLPSIGKLIGWLLGITGTGVFLFPVLALTVEENFSKHFWIMTFFDLGLFLAILK
jgi:hypothetical protein